MHHEASSDSGKMNNNMLFRPIEVKQALNWQTGYNLMSAIAGSPYFDSELYSQSLPFLNSSFHHDWLFMHFWDWTLAENRYCQFMMCYELRVSKIRTGREVAAHRLSC
jgi:hypothetical protein